MGLDLDYTDVQNLLDEEEKDRLLTHQNRNK